MEREQAPVASATERQTSSSFGAEVLRVLDTPIVDLAHALFSRSASDSPQPAQEQPASRPPTSKGQQIFSQLVPNSQLTADLKSDPATNSYTEKIPMSRCISSSMSWAWRAGPEYVVTKFASSGVSAVLPYALAFSGAKVVDALVSVSRGLGNGADALQWFGISAAVSLLAVGNSMVNRWAESRHRIKKNQEVMIDMREALTGFTPEEQFSPKVTQLVNRTLQSQWAIQSFGEKLFDLVVPTVSAIGAVAIIAPYSPLGAAIMGVFAVPYFYHSRKRGFDELAVSAELAEVNNRFGSREWTLLTGPAHLEIKLHGKTGALLEHLREERGKIDEMNLRPELRQQVREGWVQPLNVVAITGVGLVILQDVVAHASSVAATGPSIGTYGLLTGALFSLNGSVRAFAWSIGDMLRNLPQAQLAHSVMQQGLSRKQERAGSLDLSTAPAICIEDVSFHYPATEDEVPRDVLNGVSFEVRPGELLGIVGESGSGKSSLVNLLCGIYEPSQGKIKFEGRDLASVSKESLWSGSGYLRQTTSNFWSMTLRENIAVGAPQPVSDEQIHELTRQTGFAEVMKRNDLSLDSVLGQWFKQGKNLSGGESVMLAMTRQAATGAKFLVLDEPTAGLDQVRADAVLDRIRKLSDTTRIVISHDYGIASQADRILVLGAGGKVADIGTHAELLERCEVYSAAYERQKRRLST